jgi:hypothetical protein
MTKEQYFEMCEMLGSEPVESEIPVEYGDLPDEVQMVMSIYRMLRDEWEYMTGSYIGKNLVGLFELLDIYNIETIEKRYYVELIHIIDSVRINETRKASQQHQETAN